MNEFDKKAKAKKLLEKPIEVHDSSGEAYSRLANYIITGKLPDKAPVEAPEPTVDAGHGQKITMTQLIALSPISGNIHCTIFDGVVLFTNDDELAVVFPNGVKITSLMLDHQYVAKILLNCLREYAVITQLCFTIPPI